MKRWPTKNVFVSIIAFLLGAYALYVRDNITLAIIVVIMASYTYGFLRNWR